MGANAGGTQGPGDDLVTRDGQKFRVSGNMALKSGRRTEHGKTHTRSEAVPLALVHVVRPSLACRLAAIGPDDILPGTFDGP